MKINDTEYILPEHIERYIVQIAEQIKARGERGADELIEYSRTDGEIIYRRTGRTTRIIDHSIQELFKTGECTVYDHYNKWESRMRVAKIMKRRLDAEHGGGYKFNPTTLKFTL